ncbi:MAG: YtxH domain-containing protein [Vampirovibrionales bacterium]|nr:YtxH domain-containing protein [Vampirovibrionales bacterium]
MSTQNSGSFTKFMVALLAGLGVGTLLGLLFAPRSGQETRAILKSKMDDEVGRTVDTVKTRYNDTRTLVTDKVSTSVEALKNRAGTVKERAEHSLDSVRDALKSKAGVIASALKESSSELEKAGRDAFEGMSANGSSN